MLAASFVFLQIQINLPSLFSLTKYISSFLLPLLCLKIILLLQQYFCILHSIILQQVVQIEVLAFRFITVPEQQSDLIVMHNLLLAFP